MWVIKFVGEGVFFLFFFCVVVLRVRVYDVYDVYDVCEWLNL